MKHIESAKLHLEAAKNNKWDYPAGSTGGMTYEQIINEVKNGKTFEGLHVHVMNVYCTTGSIIINQLMDHQSHSFNRNYRKGFRELFERNASSKD